MVRPGAGAAVGRNGADGVVVFGSGGSLGVPVGGARQVALVEPVPAAGSAPGPKFVAGGAADCGPAELDGAFAGLCGEGGRVSGCSGAGLGEGCAVCEEREGNRRDENGEQEDGTVKRRDRRPRWILLHSGTYLRLPDRCLPVCKRKYTLKESFRQLQLFGGCIPV